MNRNDDMFWSPTSTRGGHGDFQEVELSCNHEQQADERYVLRVSFPCKRKHLVARLRRLADEIEGGNAAR